MIAKHKITSEHHPSPMNLYLWQDGAEGGPYDQNSVFEAVKSGQLPPITLARRETDGEWKPIQEFMRKGATPSPAKAPKQPKTSSGGGKKVLVGILACITLAGVGGGALWGVQAYRTAQEQKATRQLAKEGLRELKRVASMVEAGVSYRDYSEYVLEAKIKVEEVIERLPEGFDRDSLEQALTAYLAARLFWQRCVSTPKSQRYNDYVPFAAGDAEILRRFGVEFVRFESSKGNFADEESLPAFWKVASQRLTEMETLHELKE